MLILDPDACDLSQPRSLQQMATGRVLWLDEAQSTAGRNYLAYAQGAAEAVPARSCTVVDVDKATANQFYNQYHLQGQCNAPITIGLATDRLVACMSFNMPTACRSTAQAFLLQRFASAGRVVGGASRLLMAFRRRYIGPVVSFSDNRISDGALYTQLGFANDQTLPPDYRYRKNGRWFSKNDCQKRHLLRQGGVGSTERELADSLGYRRVYDLGKRRWSLA